MKTRIITLASKADKTPARHYSTMPSVEKAALIMRCLIENKAEQVAGFDLSALSACMDAVICATAKTSRHARSLADALAKFAHAQKFEWLSMEGYQNAEWVLADMNDVVINIFLPEQREAVNMEALWPKAQPITAADSLPAETVVDRAVSAADVSGDTVHPVPTMLLILDGYGLAPDSDGNAVSRADTPNLDRLFGLPECVRLDASGLAVGLPDGFMGNSEVGHLNIGAGRVVYQDMTRIDRAVADNTLADNKALTDLFDAVKAKNGRVHFAGLLSDGGVHSHINHLKALLKAAAGAGVPAVVHAFTDGRDTPPSSAQTYVNNLMPVLKQTGATLGTLCGRFYAMDRDKRWERVSRAWGMLVHGTGNRAADAQSALDAAYADGKTDEFIEPTLLGDPADVCIRSGDGVFFINFRADRGRELASAFVRNEFTAFDRGAIPETAGIVCMTLYDTSLPHPVAFPKEHIDKTLSETIAKQGWPQFHIAETEKYAHVTFFLNGGREEACPGEDRVLVDSPKDVKTYDQKPEMSIFEVTDKLLEAWNTGKYPFIVCNLANPDMVGHTGNFNAAVRALEAVDHCVSRIAAAVAEKSGRLVLTSDHGNAEMMIDPKTGQPHTAHTTNPVPMVVLENGQPLHVKSGGKLADIAPTLLALWGIRKPAAMSGTSLFVKPRTRKV